ncbi:septum formation protein Maf [Bacteriovorax stolpii]|uniref:dTTP/UTP pyrophosphatase n=1 Tax=Bacteriovorax stolpii TaxID=960 RepID=A0A2K9NR81_BACTC|nr:Maf family protein [Bacteriovorax stolpii]AUN97254.1 septum formation protein Maf [Bacteriovorax stolpii]QDK42808.1 septum formation protein Maf [Bacteriovorax stolpii]TDP52424.1 septum formation protein [Bacteriovorax stolpii]
MGSDKYHLVLGSQSPRRKQLLSYINIPFQILTADLDEVSDETAPDRIAMDLASQKARAVMEKVSGIENPFIISSDTIVVLDGKLYGKPKDKDDARAILNELSDKTHQVITGVSFLFVEQATKKLREHLFFDSTEVTFTEISKELMDDYIATGESLDKAGAYGIQGASLTFISNLSGSYSNVVGFPLDKVVGELAIVLGENYRSQFL